MRASDSDDARVSRRLGPRPMIGPGPTPHFKRRAAPRRSVDTPERRNDRPDVRRLRLGVHPAANCHHAGPGWPGRASWARASASGPRAARIAARGGGRALLGSAPEARQHTISHSINQSITQSINQSHPTIPVPVFLGPAGGDCPAVRP